MRILPDAKYYEIIYLKTDGIDKMPNDKYKEGNRTIIDAKGVLRFRKEGKVQDDIKTLPRGIYIIDGKKVLIK